MPALRNGIQDENSSAQALCWRIRPVSSYLSRDEKWRKVLFGMYSRMNWPDLPELYALLDRFEERWKFAYPGLNITAEVMRMAEWCEANRAKQPKKNWHRFATTWLARNQAAIDRAEAREMIQRMQQRCDAEVGKYRG